MYNNSDTLCFNLGSERERDRESSLKYITIIKIHNLCLGLGIKEHYSTSSRRVSLSKISSAHVELEKSRDWILGRE